MDNTGAVYERDKQIYKCSTLGRYGKFEGQRQNLVPAVIPTVPQIPKFNNGQPQNMVATTTAAAPTSMASVPNHHHQQHVMMANNSNQQLIGQRPSIQNCPLPDIPSVGTFKPMTDNDIGNNAVNDLPHNR